MARTSKAFFREAANNLGVPAQISTAARGVVIKVGEVETTVPHKAPQRRVNLALVNAARRALYKGLAAG